MVIYLTFWGTRFAKEFLQRYRLEMHRMMLIVNSTYHTPGDVCFWSISFYVGEIWLAPVALKGCILISGAPRDKSRRGLRFLVPLRIVLKRFMSG